jgi:hypothetical protein
MHESLWIIHLGNLHTEACRAHMLCVYVYVRENTRLRAQNKDFKMARMAS